MDDMIEAVVNKATVEEPWHVLSVAANRKGIKRPNELPSNKPLIISPNCEFLSTWPKMPPAPVISNCMQ